jgi:hypothetical protein
MEVLPRGPHRERLEVNRRVDLRVVVETEHRELVPDPEKDLDHGSDQAPFLAPPGVAGKALADETGPERRPQLRQWRVEREEGPVVNHCQRDAEAALSFSANPGQRLVRIAGGCFGRDRLVVPGDHHLGECGERAEFERAEEFALEPRCPGGVVESEEQNPDDAIEDHGADQDLAHRHHLPGDGEDFVQLRCRHQYQVDRLRHD